MIDLQKASYAKRLFAFLADLIAASILTAGVYLLLSAVFNTDRFMEEYGRIIAGYEAEYGVTFDLTEEQYAALGQEEKDHYRAAVDAANADPDANAAAMSYYKSVFAIFAGGIIISAAVLGFAVPLALGDGRTLGKRLFGLGVMRLGFTRVTPAVLIARNVVGKGVMELLLPAMLLFSAVTGVTGVFGLAALGLFLAAEAVSIAVTYERRPLHDVLAGTAVVDWDSQLIFPDAEARDAYIASHRADGDGACRTE
jgi:uncharacterized RDD family membrane protein YckC